MPPTSVCSSWRQRRRNGRCRAPSPSPTSRPRRLPEKPGRPSPTAFSGSPASAPGTIAGNAREPSATGFLGLASCGRSTFATVAEAPPADLEEIEGALALHFVTAHGAPGLEAALPAAKEEARFVLDLCR